MGWDDMTIRLRLRGVRAVKVLEDTFLGWGTVRRVAGQNHHQRTEHPSPQQSHASHPSRRASRLEDPRQINTEYGRQATSTPPPEPKIGFILG